VNADPLLDRVRARLAERPGQLADVARDESRLLVDSVALTELSQELAAQLDGAGPLEPLLALPDVTDVLVNSADRVWIDRGHGLELTAVRFGTDAEIRALAARLAAQAGRRLDDAAPYVDAALPDGTRLHAILPPLVDHPTLSLRVLARRSLSLAELVARGAMPEPVADVLRAVVAARLNVLVSGGTGTGKTTLLSALLGCVPPGDRIVTVEDAAELAVQHPHVVGLRSRTANVELAGAIGMSTLVRQALRMRVDRLVVGEFRGAEIVELLAALNTGHAGGAATVHANSVRDLPARLTALAALGGMSADVLEAQAASALQVLVHLTRRADGRRMVSELALWPRAGLSSAPPMVWTAAAGAGLGLPQLSELLRQGGFALPEAIAGLRERTQHSA
jgi:pilus assembly protein CpaF